MLTFAPGLSRYTNNSYILYNIRIFIALTGVTLVPWYLEQPKLTIPLVLGVVAAALADLDDRLSGRLRNLVITLFCFFVASVSIELLSPYPWLFSAGLLVSTCGFIMLGALGQRYATIAFGALLIAVYTMLGSSLYDTWYIQPLLLLVGAIWYNLLTLMGHLLFPIRPLQDNLIHCYEQLAGYLETKSALFDPDEESNFDKQQIDVAMASGNLVTMLNQTKASLLTRLKGDRGQRGTRRTLHYYFVAQDIHERASSVHFQYQALSNTLRHSDILFRFQRLLSMQAKACRQVSLSLLNRQKYIHNAYFERSFRYLEDSLNRSEINHDSDRKLLDSLKNSLKNLKDIDGQLANIESEQVLAKDLRDTSLSDDPLNGLGDIKLRICRQLTPESALFRHAIRMSTVLFVGYGIIQLAGLHHGYWIMLTSLFVCQPNYNATQRRLRLRIVGTLAGILIGLPILYFVPSLEGQLILIVLSGVLFFAFRNIQYAHATMFITLLVLLCFNLLGEGFEIAVPRVVDTLVGCAIAWAAVTFIWPDWRFRHLPAVLTRCIDANCRYLDAILVQYHQGKDNRLEYRVARRNAHNSNAELASVVSNITAEPKKRQPMLEPTFRFLCLNHTFLGYISALGAHRDKMESSQMLSLLNDAICYIDSVLHQDSSVVLRLEHMQTQLAQNIEKLETTTDSKEVLVLQQISLMLGLLPEYMQLNQDIIHSSS